MNKKTASALAVLLALTASVSAQTVLTPRGQSRPNILFLFADDMRWSTVSAYGFPEMLTPNLDALAQGGTRFDRAYIMGGNSGAVCQPSRAMMMTSRTLWRITNTGNNIPAGQIMMQEFYKSKGYATFGTGKWHNGKSIYNRAFSTAENIFFGGMHPNNWNVTLYHYDPAGLYPVADSFVDAGVHGTEQFASAALEFLDHYDYRGNNPFFCYVPFTAPHDPRDTFSTFHDLYPTSSISMPPNFMATHFDTGELIPPNRDENLAAYPRTTNEVRQHISDYYAMVSHLDARVGDIVQKIKDKDLEKNTLIVFAADNGLAVGQHGHMGKQTVYEHSVHVPMILSGRGVPTNQVVTHLFYLQDIFPTVCELTGQTPPGSAVDGISFAPAIQGEPQTNKRDSLIFAYKNYQRGYRNDEFKMIHFNVDGAKTSELFRLTVDPWEMTNLAYQTGFESTVSNLTSEMKSMLQDAGDAIATNSAWWP